MILTLHFVDLGRQYLSIKEEIDAAAIEAIASTEYVLGEELTRFEEEFASYCEVASASASPPAPRQSSWHSRRSASPGATR